jgi:hypothetical protein
LPVHAGYHVAGAQSGPLSRAVFERAGDEDPSRCTKPEGVCNLGRNGAANDADPTPYDTALGDYLRHDLAREVDGNGETHALRAAALGKDGGVDTDQLAPRVDEGAPGVMRPVPLTIPIMTV